MQTLEPLKRLNTCLFPWSTGYNELMKTPGVIKAILILLSLCFASTIQSRDSVAVNPGNESSRNIIALKECEQSIFQQVNQIRANKDNDLEQLKLDTGLQVTAKNHCLDMIQRDYFEHISPEGINPHIRITSQHRSQVIFSTGENIWKRESTISMDNEKTLASEIVTDWMNSRYHRDNILAKSFNRIGISVIQIDHSIFAVQHFAGSLGQIIPEIPAEIRRGGSFNIDIEPVTERVLNPRKFDLISLTTEQPVCEPTRLRTGNLSCPSGQYRIRLYFLHPDGQQWEIYDGPTITVP